MQHSLLAQILARDPRKIVRFPDVPLDQALRALQQLETTLQELKAAPPLPPEPAPAALESMPPVVPVEMPVKAPEPEGAPASVQVPAATEDLEALSGSLTALATQVWRARVRIIDPETGAPREEMRRIHRHIEGAFEAFNQLGLVINDWINQPYDAGLPVKVLTFQPTPGLQRDTVLEAVRPTVIWKDRLLQMGEVIVGIPQNTEASPQ
jgi:hypothetical protein